MKNKNKENKKKLKNHLFSPYTDRCIYCDISAQNDSTENKPCEVATQEQINEAPDFD
jgi:hypothetical protein